MREKIYEALERHLPYFTPFGWLCIILILMVPVLVGFAYGYQMSTEHLTELIAKHKEEF